MEKCEVIRNMIFGELPSNPTYAWGAIADNPINPWELEDEKKPVTNVELVSQMETIKTLIVILLRSKGL